MFIEKKANLKIKKGRRRSDEKRKKEVMWKNEW